MADYRKTATLNRLVVGSIPTASTNLTTHSKQLNHRTSHTQGEPLAELAGLEIARLH
jgi:hypothetical protein